MKTAVGNLCFVGISMNRFATSFVYQYEKEKFNSCLVSCNTVFIQFTSQSKLF